MPLDVVLPIAQRVGARYEHDRLVARHLADLRRLDEIALDDVPVSRRGAHGPAALVECEDRDRLLAGHLRDLPVGLVRLAAEEQRRVAAVDDGLNEKNYILPGLGDAGDRIYGTR